MFKSKLEKFIVKRVLIYMILLSIIGIIVLKNRWIILFGLFVGTIISIAKFSSYAWAFGRIFRAARDNASHRPSTWGSVVVFAINQLILLPLLLLAYFWDHRVFTGFVAGILLVPFVIMINSITEALGITKNDFE